MKNKNFLIVLFALFALFFYQATHGLFSDTAVSSNNTFTASDSFSGPIGTGTPTPTITLIVTPPGGQTVNPRDVVINEINWAGSGRGDFDEWIELKNTTETSISLDGWIIENLGTSTKKNIIIASGTISPNGLFLISNYSQANSYISIDPDIVDSDISLDNGGEQLILKDSIGTVIDIANDSGKWFAGTNIPPRKSMERNSYRDDGSVSSNWHTATAAFNLDLEATESATPRHENSSP